MAITEFLFAPLKPGSDVTSPDTDEGKIAADANTTLTQRPGMQRSFWGLQVENKDQLVFIVDWNALDDHKAFMNDPIYQPFMKNFSAILGGTPSMFHVPLEPFPALSAIGKSRAPVTEVLTVHFPSDYSATEQEAFSKGLESLQAAIATAEGFTGAAGGWSIENNIAYEGKETKVYQALIGWTSVDAHMKARELQAFKDNISKLREAPKAVGMSVVHVPFEEVHGEAGQ